MHFIRNYIVLVCLYRTVHECEIFAVILPGLRSNQLTNSAERKSKLISFFNKINKGKRNNFWFPGEKNCFIFIFNEKFF